MNAQIPGKVFTLAADGDATGFVNITSNTLAYPGSVGRLIKSDGTLSQKVVLTELSSTNLVGIRFLPENINDVKLRTGAVKFPHEGRSSCVGYTTGSLLIIEDQLVAVAQPLYDPLMKI